MLLEGNLVPGAGIEPARCCHRQILSLLRLPVSPPGQEVRSLSGAEAVLQRSKNRMLDIFERVAEKRQERNYVRNDAPEQGPHRSFA